MYFGWSPGFQPYPPPPLFWKERGGIKYMLASPSINKTLCYSLQPKKKNLINPAPSSKITFHKNQNQRRGESQMKFDLC